MTTHSTAPLRFCWTWPLIASFKCNSRRKERSPPFHRRAIECEQAFSQWKISARPRTPIRLHRYIARHGRYLERRTYDQDDDRDTGQRLTRPLCFLRLDPTTTAMPAPSKASAVVDLNTMKVVRIEEYGKWPLPPESCNYSPDRSRSLRTASSRC